MVRLRLFFSLINFVLDFIVKNVGVESFSIREYVIVLNGVCKMGIVDNFS